jgi:undecaprenyl-diphosphatase
MADHLKALMIGIIEGLTEFLPVSSTAHIRLCQELLDIAMEDGYWKMFAIVIQLGAILAVVVYFRYRLIDFLRFFPRGESGDRRWWNHPLSLVMLSFVITALPCFLLDKYIGENLESFVVIGGSLVIGGIVMWAVDKFFSPRATTLRMDDITPLQAIVIGSAQIFAATFPGTSRSMATIAGGQIMGLSRPAALEFSFFLSLPVMFSATGYKLAQYILQNGATITAQQWLLLAMSWVNQHGFTPFAIYRILVGTAVLIWLV